MIETSFNEDGSTAIPAVGDMPKDRGMLNSCVLLGALTWG